MAGIADKQNLVVTRLCKVMNGHPVASALPVALPANAADRLAALFDGQYDRLYRLARRLAPSIDDALDLVQETLLKAARSARAVPIGHSNEEASLVRMLINIRRDQWRKSATRKRHDQEIGTVDLRAAVRFEVRLAEDNPAGGLQAARVGTDRTIYLHPEAIVTNSDIATARVVPGDGRSLLTAKSSWRPRCEIRLPNWEKSTATSHGSRQNEL